MDQTPDDGTVQEPDNSTVDDWFGQNAARDQEVADQVAADADSPEEAEEAFDEQADGQERYEAGHQRPDDEPEGDGDAVGRPE